MSILGYGFYIHNNKNYTNKDLTNPDINKEIGGSRSYENYGIIIQLLMQVELATPQIICNFAFTIIIYPSRQVVQCF